MATGSEVNALDLQKMVMHSKLAIVWHTCTKNKIPIRSPVKAAPSTPPLTQYFTLLLFVVLCMSPAPLV